eukprot:761101_1
MGSWESVGCSRRARENTREADSQPCVHDYLDSSVRWLFAKGAIKLALKLLLVAAVVLLLAYCLGWFEFSPVQKAVVRKHVEGGVDKMGEFAKLSREAKLKAAVDKSQKLAEQGKNMAEKFYKRTSNQFKPLTDAVTDAFLDRLEELKQ